MNSAFLNQVVFANKIIDYIYCLIFFVVIVTVIKIIQKIVINHLNAFAKKTATSIDDFIMNLISKIGLPFAYFAGIYFSLQFLQIDPRLNSFISKAISAVMVGFAARFISLLIEHVFKIYSRRRENSEAVEKSLTGILRVIVFIVWAAAIAFYLDNIGFKITAVLAGLGIGGVAVALAAQAVLSDLFSYFAILFDRPFEIGDFIIIGDYLGTVDHIGIKTTRIASLSGEQLVFSNSDLTNSRVRNYKRMAKRRVLFHFGVIYATSLEHLKEIPTVIKEIINSIETAIFDRAHFQKFGDFSLDFEVVYYVQGGDYNKYMDIQQIINLKIKEEFLKRNIEFAFPTRTLYVNKES